jgi:hypothetical protein
MPASFSFGFLSSFSCNYYTIVKIITVEIESVYCILATYIEEDHVFKKIMYLAFLTFVLPSFSMAADLYYCVNSSNWLRDSDQRTFSIEEDNSGRLTLAYYMNFNLYHIHILKKTDKDDLDRTVFVSAPDEFHNTEVSINNQTNISPGFPTPVKDSEIKISNFGAIERHMYCL